MSHLDKFLRDQEAKREQLDPIHNAKPFEYAFGGNPEVFSYMTAEEIMYLVEKNLDFIKKNFHPDKALQLKIPAETLNAIQKQVNNAIRDLKEAKNENQDALREWVRLLQTGEYLDVVLQKKNSAEQLYQTLAQNAYMDFAQQQERILSELKELNDKNKSEYATIAKVKQENLDIQKQFLLNCGIKNTSVHAEVVYGSTLGRDNIQMELDQETEKLQAGKDLLLSAVDATITHFIDQNALKIDEPFVYMIKNSFITSISDELCITLFEHHGAHMKKALEPLTEQLKKAQEQIQLYRQSEESVALVEVEQSKQTLALPFLPAFFAHPAFVPLFSLQHLPLLLTVANNFLKHLLLQVHSDKKGSRTKNITMRLVKALEGIEKIKNMRDRESLVVVWEQLKNDVLHVHLSKWDEFERKTTRIKEEVLTYKSRLLEGIQEKNAASILLLQQQKFLKNVSEELTVMRTQYANNLEFTSEQKVITLVDAYAKRLRSVFHEGLHVLSVQDFMSNKDPHLSIQKVLDDITTNCCIFDRPISYERSLIIQEQFPTLEYTFEYVLKTYVYQVERYIAAISEYILELSPKFEPLVKGLERYCIEKLQDTNLREDIIITAFDHTVTSLDKRSLEENKNKSHVDYIALLVSILSLGDFIKEGDIPGIHEKLRQDFAQLIKKKFTKFYQEEQNLESVEWDTILHEGNITYLKKQVRAVLSKRHSGLKKVPTYDKQDLHKNQELWVSNLLRDFEKGRYSSFEHMFVELKKQMNGPALSAFQILDHHVFMTVLGEWTETLSNSFDLKREEETTHEHTLLINVDVLQQTFEYYLESFKAMRVTLLDQNIENEITPYGIGLRRIIMELATLIKGNTPVQHTTLQTIFSQMIETAEEYPLGSMEELLVLLHEDEKAFASYAQVTDTGNIFCSKDQFDVMLIHLLRQLLEHNAIAVKYSEFIPYIEKMLLNMVGKEFTKDFALLQQRRNRLKGRMPAVQKELQKITIYEKQLSQLQNKHKKQEHLYNQIFQTGSELLGTFVQYITTLHWTSQYGEFLFYVKNLLKSLRENATTLKKEMEESKESIEKLEKNIQKKHKIETRHAELLSELENMDREILSYENGVLELNLNTILHRIQQYFLFGGKIFHVGYMSKYVSQLEEKVHHIVYDKDESFEHMLRIMRMLSVKKVQLSKEVLALSTSERYVILQSLAEDLHLDQSDLQKILAEVTNRMLTFKHMTIQGRHINDIVSYAYLSVIEQYLAQELKNIPKQSPIYFDKQYVDVHRHHNIFREKLLFYLRKKIATNEVYVSGVKNIAFPLQTEEIIANLSGKNSGESLFMHSKYALDNHRKFHVPHELTEEGAHWEKQARDGVSKLLDQHKEFEYSSFHYALQTIFPDQEKQYVASKVKGLQIRGKRVALDESRLKIDQSNEYLYPVGSISEEKYATYLDEILSKSTDMRDTSLLFGQGLSLSLRVFFKSKIFASMDTQMNPGDLLLAYSMKDHKVKVAGKILGTAPYKDLYKETDLDVLENLGE